ncbi:MAG: hypothetical protein H0X35_00475 [Pseudonocardiales bacterium]|nr:hypothetical protein [Pseudonocardiales bacterium]
MDTSSSVRRPAFGYLLLPSPRGLSPCGPSGPDHEVGLRRDMAEYARLEGLELDSVFVDVVGESPYAFAAMRELLRRRPDVRTVVLPGLEHLAQLTTVADLSRAGVARYLGVAVLLLRAEPLSGAPGPTAAAGPRGRTR